ncbi:MAG: VOC family protein [Chromatiales bacterium]|nr:VOC family protein [Chromatiales bacterium]
MIDHLSTYAIDFDATWTFYGAVLPCLGYPLQAQEALHDDELLPGRRIAAFGPAGKCVFWIIETRREITPRHLAFSADTRHLVDTFHAAGLEGGGRDFGAPGVRPEYHQHYYGAFLHDPDGNNVEAVCHTPAQEIER